MSVRPLLIGHLLFAVVSGTHLARSPIVAAQGVVLRGRVVAEDSTPIVGATATLTALGYAVTADASGRFVMAGTPGGTLELAISAPGFRSQNVSVVLPRRDALSRDFVLLSDGAPRPEEPGDFIRGRVTAPDGSPIAYANIQVNGGRRIVSTDSGRFSAPVSSAGGATLLVRRIGFEPEEVRFAARPDTAIVIRMKPAATALPELRVTARSPFVGLDLHGFYRRREEAQRGPAHVYFITPEDLDLRKPVHIPNALEHLPNVRIQPGNAEQVQTDYLGPLNLAAPRNMRISDGAGCPYTVFLDRIRITPRLTRGGLLDDQINVAIQPGSVAGIEVYPGGRSAPPEFSQLQGTCGVVLIWSK
jgi:hypothetical protein